MSCSSFSSVCRCPVQACSLYIESAAPSSQKHHCWELPFSDVLMVAVRHCMIVGETGFEPARALDLVRPHQEHIVGLSVSWAG
jgi:hypothetical protein